MNKGVHRMIESGRTDISTELRQVSYDHVNGRVQAAYVMDRFPLCDYCRLNGENEQVMDALLMGDHPMADDFFMNILSCAQMLDTKLVIRLARKDAEEKLLWYTEKWPLLKKACSLFLEDEPCRDSKTRQPYHLNEKVTSLPFAEVRFYEWDGETEPEQLISKMIEDISWILSVSSNIATNPAKAEQTAEYMHSRQRRSFIGYLYEDGGRCLNGSGDGCLNRSGDGRLNEAGDGCLNGSGDGYPNEDGDGYLNEAGRWINLTKSSVPYGK